MVKPTCGSASTSFMLAALRVLHVDSVPPVGWCAAIEELTTGGRHRLGCGPGPHSQDSWVTEQGPPARRIRQLWEAPVFTERTSVGLDVHARSVVAAAIDKIDTACQAVFKD